MGVRTGARILTDVVGKNSASAGHLASYAGLSPETWRSESSIRGAHANPTGTTMGYGPALAFNLRIRGLGG